MFKNYFKKATALLIGLILSASFAVQAQIEETQDETQRAHGQGLVHNLEFLSSDGYFERSFSTISSSFGGTRLDVWHRNDTPVPVRVRIQCWDSEAEEWHIVVNMPVEAKYFFCENLKKALYFYSWKI